MDISINYLAILACGVAHMILGALWYSPLLFGRVWLRLMDKSQEDIKAMNPPAALGYALNFVFALVMAYVLVHILHAFEAETLLAGLQGGFWSWLGFVILSGLGSVMFEGRRFGLFAIYTFYMLVSLLVMGSILTVWI
jgi:hypothetical protein